ncbi:hypothetical protein R3I94_021463 [Phoxinus phoxinus]
MEQHQTLPEHSTPPGRSCGESPAAHRVPEQMERKAEGSGAEDD